MRIEQVQVVKAPREHVFQAWTDYEAYPSWDPVMFTQVKVTERVGNTACLDGSQIQSRARSVESFRRSFAAGT